jgi:hypothetical protein
MKALLTLILLTALAACASPLPKPVNANGSISPTATVADMDLAYQDAAALATTFVTTCHTASTTPGCSEGLVAKMKSAGEDANKKLHAAHAAVKDFPTGGTAVDKAIADLRAALAFLASYTGQIPTSIATRNR